MNELILVVDDEPKIVKLARDYLEQGAFRVTSAGAGAPALEIARREHPDLIVLDLRLPDMDGLDVCRAIRRESDVPVLMLTARADEFDRLLGLELGADDYLTKPFSPRELVARVRAILRRSQQPGEQRRFIRAGALQIDLDGHEVTRDGISVHLTPNEFLVLSTLATRPGQTFTRAQLLDAMYDVDVGGFDRSVDSHIKNLRRKIEPDASSPSYVLTVYGVGYKFRSD